MTVCFLSNQQKMMPRESENSIRNTALKALATLQDAESVIPKQKDQGWEELWGTVSDGKRNVKRVPPIVAEKVMEIAGQAIDRQIEIMHQQQQKGEDFVNEEVRNTRIARLN